MIKAEIVADSKNEFGNRITTMVVTFPRFILAELNTHRMFSRNSASSRAIPFEKLIKSVKENPFVPIAFQKNHAGMQGTEYFTGEEAENIEKSWRYMAARTVESVELLGSTGLTKQLVNRPLEAYMWHTVIITATEWENFFALRCPKYVIQCAGGEVNRYRSKKEALKRSFEDIEAKDENDPLFWLRTNKGQAEIHMMALAEAMWDAYNESEPRESTAGEWHIPFVDDVNFLRVSTEDALKIATARCARVSYTVVGEEDKPANYENDIKLHDRLAASGHWSPFEHCAQAIGTGFEVSGTELLGNNHWSGNFRGFIQYRKMFNNENITV